MQTKKNETPLPVACKQAPTSSRPDPCDFLFWLRAAVMKHSVSISIENRSEYKLKTISTILNLFLFIAVSANAQETLLKNNTVPINEQAVENCKKWFESRLFTLEESKFSEFDIKEIPQGFCIDGGILDQSDHKKFKEIISRSKIKNNIIFVVRSPGGLAIPAINIADEISRMNSTVIAVDLCASSCANYIMAAAKKRIIYKNALLLFHGAISYREIESLLPSDWDEDSLYLNFSDSVLLKSIWHKINMIRMQEKLLLDSGIRGYMFSWMEIFYHMETQEKEMFCPSKTSMILYSPSVLEKFNYIFFHYDGPRSQKELDSIYPSEGMKHRICYWDDKYMETQ